MSPAQFAALLELTPMTPGTSGGPTSIATELTGASSWRQLQAAWPWATKEVFENVRARWLGPDLDSCRWHAAADYLRSIE